MKRKGWVILLAMLAVCMGSMVTVDWRGAWAPPLTEADLSVGGLQWIPDTADARRVVGSPPTAKPYVTRIDDEGLHLTDWVYPGLRLIFSQNGKLRWARVTGRAWPTHRGLRVGDPVSRITALYGPPLNASAKEYSYQLPGDERPSRLGVSAMFEKGRVTVIGIGLIVEGD